MPEDGLSGSAPSARNRSLGDTPRGLLDRMMIRWLDSVLRSRSVGSLQLTMPSGVTAFVGPRGQQPHAQLAVKRYRALWKLLRGGSLGFAESYMDGDLDTANLTALFDYYVENEPAVMAAIPSIEVTRQRDRRVHSQRRNTRAGSRRNIAAHYDLGNDFYRLWLDPSMLYSSAIYPNAQSSLEDAQRLKLSRILSALELRPGHQLLEIGCGWGALAQAAAQNGAQVDAITISQQQLHITRQRIEAAGLIEKVDVRFEDYRDTRGVYDRLVSIEMIEAVGDDNWPLYFETVAARLAPGGSAVIQAITIHEDAFARYRQNPDFIQLYIFPGGMLPTVSRMETQAHAAGLTFETVERFGTSYALTLQDWRRRFEANWPRIAALGFDERFRRMWLYYLAYCEVGFQRGLIDVGLYRMHKVGSI